MRYSANELATGENCPPKTQLPVPSFQTNHTKHNKLTDMKLHLPVKLRASLIAAVIAVSASVYNAYGANTYTEFGNNDNVFETATPNLGGNDYIAEQATKTYYYTDNTKTVAIAQGVDNKWYELDANGALTTTEYVPANPAWTPFTETVTDDGYLTFQVASPAQGTTDYVTHFDGDTALTADVVQFNNSVVTQDGGVEGKTSITADRLEVNQHPVGGGYSAVQLEQVSIDAGATALSTASELNINNAEAADSVLDLGAVSGAGSLYITGGTYDDNGTEKKTSVSMAGVALANKGNLGLTTADAAITGHVAVNDLKLTDSDTNVTGNVSAGGTLIVDADSSITASGDIASRTATGTGTATIDGTVTSTGGDIFLDNGTVNGTAEATTGNVTLSNMDVTDGATVKAGDDLTLTQNSTIVDTPDDGKDITIEVGDDLNVEGSVPSTSNPEQGTLISGVTAEVGGDVNISADANEKVDISGSTIDMTGDGAFSATGDGEISVTDSKVDGANGITISGSDVVVDESIFDNNSGSISVENGGSLTDSVVVGGTHMEISGDSANLTGTKVVDLEGDIKIAGSELDGIELSTQGTSGQDVSDLDQTVGGSIIIEDSSLSNATIQSGVKATLDAEYNVTGYTPVAATTVELESSPSAPADVPYGDIKVTRSSLDTVTLATQSGDVTIDGARVPLMTDAARSIGTYSGSNDTANANKIRFTAGLGYLGASDMISSIKVEEWSGGTASTGVTATLKKNGVTIATSQPVDLTGTNGNMVSFDFGGPVPIDPAATDYVLEFSSDVRIRLYDAHSKIVQYGGNDQNWSAKVSVGYFDADSYTSQLIGSSITTESGALSMTNTYTAASTGEGAQDTVLKATANSTITDSMLDGGTDVEIKEGDLEIRGSALRKDVNLTAGQSVAIKSGSIIAIDGGDEAHGASITAGANFWMGDADSLAGNVANIRNADIQVTGKTTIDQNATLNLTNVYAKADDGTISAANLGKVGVSNSPANTAKGVLNIEGSTINMAAIQGNAGAWPPAEHGNLQRYFGTVSVKKDSTVNIAGHAFINELSVNSGQVDTSKEQHSSVTIGGMAKIKKLNIRGEGEGTYVTSDGVGGDGPEVTIKGNARIEQLGVGNEGALSLVGNGSTVSTIARITSYESGTHGVINVVGGQLTTPVLSNAQWLNVGLNGATVILGEVAAEGNALAASTEAVNPHVKLHAITDAHQTGVDQLDTRSTIKTSGLIRLDAAPVTAAGTETAVEGAKAYMYKVNCGQGTTVNVQAGMKLYKENASGELVLLQPGDTLNDGDMVAKYNFEYTTTTLDTGAVKNTGATVSESLAGLTDAEDDFLAPITAPVSTQAGATVTIGGKDYTVLATGQLTLAVDAKYLDGASATLGTVETKNDGIASLEMKGYGNNPAYFSANKTDINAYELAQVTKYWKDGAEIDTATYNTLSDAEKATYSAEYGAVAGTGFINIEGRLTGSDNKLTADNNINIDGIGVSGTDANGNVLTSNRGTVSVDANGITGSSNELTSTIGAVSVEGTIAGDENKLTAGTNVTTDDILGSSNELTAETGSITTGSLGSADVQADGNILDANTTINTGAITGDSNELTAGTNITTGAITGDDNELEAEEGTISTGAIGSATDATAAGEAGKGNTLVAKSNVEVGTIIGDCNEITSKEGYILLKNNATLEGDYNKLDAALVVQTGSIDGDENTVIAGKHVDINGSLIGSNNSIECTATTETTDNAVDISEGIGGVDAESNENSIVAQKGNIYLGATSDISLGGSDNEIVAHAGSITTTGKIKGSDNLLDASDTITTGAIEGSSNELIAGTSIETGDILGSSNELTAETGSITTGTLGSADVQADENILDAATTIETGDITGDRNQLLAGTGIETGAIAGDGNELISDEGDVVVASVDGEGNALTATTGDVYINGVLQGVENTVDAGKITVGTLAGSGQELTSRGVTRTTDVAIDITELSATGSTIVVDDVAGAVGSIKIGTMNAEKVDDSTNTISTPQGNVTIGKLDGATAKTAITVGDLYGITVEGLDDDLNTASNQNWRAGSVDIQATGGLELTDSTVNAEEVTGTSLSLEGASKLTADTVELDSLSIADTSWVDADEVTVDDLTIDGPNATMKGSPNLTVTEELTLKNGAKLDGVDVSTAGLTLENSSLDIAELTGVTGLTLKGSVANIGEGLTGLTGDVVAETLNGVASSLTTDAISTSGQVKADGSTITTTKGGITADAGVTALDGGTITSAQGIDSNAGVTADGASSSIVANGPITAEEAVKATNGGSIATTGSIEAASMEITGNGKVSASSVALQGSLSASEGTLTAATVSGATSADLSAATITGSLGMSGTDADVTASNGTSIGSITDANDVTLTGSSKVTGDIGMSGELNATGGSIGSVTGATDVNTNGTSVGDIGMSGELVARGGEIASVTGATNVKSNGSNVGSIEMSGELEAKGGSIGSVAGATDVTTNGTNVGTIEMSGKLEATGGVIASVTGATGADLTDATITGALNATSGTIDANGGSIGSITGTADTVDLTGTEAGSIALSENGTLNVSGGSTGAVQNAVANATLNTTTIGSGLTVKDTLASIGDVTVKGDVDTKNLSVSNGTLTAEGDVTVTEKTTLSNGTVVADTFTTKEIELVDMNGSVEKLDASNDVTMTGTSLNVTSTDADAVKVGGDLSLSDAVLDSEGGITVTGAATVADGADLTGTSLTATGLTVEDKDAAGNSSKVTIDGGIDLNNGGLTVADGATVAAGGDITEAGAVNLTESARVEVKGGDLTGATTVTVASSSSLCADVDASGAVEVQSNGTINGDVSTDSTVAVDAGTITGTVTAGDDVSVSGATGTIIGGVETDGGVTVTDGSITGGVSAGSAVAVNGGSIEGGVTVTKDAVTVTKGGEIAGDIAGASTVTVNKGAQLIGSVNNATGDVTVDNGTITASVTTAGGAMLTDATVKGSVTAEGAASLNGATIGGALSAGDTTVGKSSSVGSASVAGLTVAEGATLTAEGGIVTAGDLDIAGKVVSNTSDITLAGDGKVSADVTAAAGELSIEGNLDAAQVTLTGKTVDIDGTLNAGKGVTLVGTVTGDGAIVKTGGDTLALAGDTKIGGVTVKDSTLDVADGADLGKLNLSGSTMQIAGEKTMGAVKVSGGSLDEKSVVVADVKLGQRSGSDQILNSGKFSIDGAVVVINDMGTNEANVADQDRHTVVTGTVDGSFAEDVVHNYDTLNVHADGGDIVFSKNYKGAANKTENQAATADALASLSSPTGELASVMDALKHTRSEADALAALDSLGGAGITGLQKAISDEAKEHLQTLRSTMKALSADVNRRFDASGQPIDGVQSSAISASVTGGNSELNGDENCGDYSRNSIGGMVAMAHALYNGWTFGASFAFSYADAECGDVSMEGDFIYVDLAMMHKGARLTQTGTIGAAFINFDTERDVLVNAGGHSYSGTAEGSTSAVAINMSYEMAYDLIKTDDGHRLGSVVMAEATFAQIDGMEEEGMGNAGVRSDFDDVASFTFGIGGRYTYEYGSVLNPGFFSLEAMVVAEAGDNTPKVNNTFIGGGQSYSLVGPEAGEIGLRLNAGWLLPIGEQTGFFMNATSEFRADQTEVGGSAGLKYSF